MNPLRLAAGSMLASALFTTGCSLQSTAPISTNNPISGNASAATVHGSVHGGQQPVANGRVYVMQANTAGYGAPSISLLTSGDGADSIGNYVLTDATGAFALTGTYSCTPGTQAYILVKGGVPIFGGQDNAALSLVGALGACPASGDYSATVPFVNVNELTTVAAMYSVAGFATDVLHVSSSGTPLAAAGLANAFANAGNLVSIARGEALSAPANHSGVVPDVKINTLGDVIAPCVNSDGTGAGCSLLFANALGDSGVPSDTASAVLNIAHRPGDNVAALANLVAPTSPFQPTLTTAPNDWSLAVVHTNAHPGAVRPVVDALGNVWFNDAQQQLTQVSPNGDLLTQAALPSLATSALALSPGAQIFMTAPLGFTTDGLNEVQPQLPAQAPPATWAGMESAAAFDSTGKLWVALSGFDGIGEYPTPTTTAETNTFTPTSLLLCGTESSIAVDSSDSVWVSCNAQNRIVKIGNAGLDLSGATGFTGVVDPKAIALDAQDQLWVANSDTTVSAMSSTGVALPGSPFAVSENAADITVDGVGSVWVLGSQGVYRMDGTGTLLTGNGLQSAVGGYAHAALDNAGNLWATAPGSNAVVQYIGVAAPVVTPAMAGAHAQLP